MEAQRRADLRRDRVELWAWSSATAGQRRGVYRRLWERDRNGDKRSRDLDGDWRQRPPGTDQRGELEWANHRRLLQRARHGSERAEYSQLICKTRRGDGDLGNAAN